MPLTTNSFIEKAKKIHGDKYIYSKVKYKNTREKIIIICSKHGEFLQKPNNHITGRGCLKCRNENTRIRCSSTTSEFIEKSKSIHDNKFDYSKVDYKNAYTRVEIICQKHGSFNQIPSYHLNGCGCPKCSGLISNGELEWLEYMELKENECQIQFDKWWVDGFKNGIIYEFLGNYYHGNPEIYVGNEWNNKAKKSMKQLYEETFNRFEKISKSTGHIIKYIWEKDWNEFKKGIVTEVKICVYKNFRQN